MRSRCKERLELRWAGGAVGFAYLGDGTWRVTSSGDRHEGLSTDKAVESTLTSVFTGVAAGEEVQRRAPLILESPTEELLRMDADERGSNAWRYRTRDVAGIVGAHCELAGFLTEQIAGLADLAWAPEAEHRRSAPLADRFSTERFAAALDAAALAVDLEAELWSRVRSHPSSVVAMESAMDELAEAGHRVEHPAKGAWLVTLPSGQTIFLELGDDDAR